MGDLFESGPLEQNTGIISERWGQDGSTLINLYGAGLSGTPTLYTVTAGKKLYIKTVTYYIIGAPNFEFADNADVKYNKTVVVLEAGTIVFDSPLEFSTSVKFTSVSNANVTMTGWEE